mgnify:CR=1 FL=1
MLNPLDLYDVRGLLSDEERMVQDSVARMVDDQVLPIIQHHFEDLHEQHEASVLGMWGFLITEILFFGGLITSYIVLRGLYPEVFLYGSHQLDWKLGGLNTLVLIVSSLTMALAVRAAAEGSGMR